MCIGISTNSVKPCGYVEKKKKKKKIPWLTFEYFQYEFKLIMSYKTKLFTRTFCDEKNVL